MHRHLTLDSRYLVLSSPSPPEHQFIGRRGGGWSSNLEEISKGIAAMIRFIFLYLIALAGAATGFSFSGIVDTTMRGSSTSSQLIQRRSHRSSALFAYENGGSRSINGGRTLSTNEIIHPDIYLGTSPLMKSIDEPVPLFVGLQLLIRAVTDILDADSTSHDPVLSHLDSTSILRIEQPIAAVHATDPLCWIHAQQRSINQLRRILQSNPVTNSSSDNALPLIYFRDAEGQVEAVALGRASPSYSESWDPFAGKRIWDTVNGAHDGVGDEGDHHVPHMFKERELPPGARVYGGSRFDWEYYHQKMKSSKGELDDRDDWDDFGGDRGGYWILPTVELRREIVDEETIVNETDEVTSENRKKSEKKRVTMAVHLHNLAPPSSGNHYRQGWRDAASHVITVLEALTDEISPAVPCTTLPPVVSRSEATKEGEDDADSGLAFERGVTEALRQIQSNVNGDEETLRKVVLARKVELNFDSSMSGLDVIMRMKFGGHIGHLFYMNPGDDRVNNNLRDRGEGLMQTREFLGCTPERLFRVNRSGHDRIVTSEALAGTRIRGLTPSADNELLRELLSSKKDILENEITGQFIRNALNDLETNGWLEKSQDVLTKSHQQRYFVRRLRHLQHICQTFEGRLSSSASVIDVSRSLLRGLHPTPAVCGDSPDLALEFIRKYETFGFDRGYYAGPFGYIGHDTADIVVAIRSALVTNYCESGSGNSWPILQQLQSNSQNTRLGNETPSSKVSIFGGAGIVEGSTVQGEWTETSHKIGVLATLFPSSPITLQSSSSPNVAWSTAFIEELVRCGITQFYISPGSRNTPLTSAIYKSMRSNVGVIRAISVHDERGAGFRAVGYARQNGRPAVVVTSSGTAVANLYPSVVEASSDGVPLLILTADRPYENRDTGSNQSIDQVKIFSPTYIRWFRDILPPSDDVPVSLALSDANHAVAISNQLMGPVHLNIQFRENLAPEGGPIRNDNRIGSTTTFNNLRFTDVPGFSRWSHSGRPWQDTFYPSNNVGQSILEVAELIIKSRRGIIVTGNLRDAQCNSDGTDSLSTTISYFAKIIGFPILAGIQSGALRRELPVVPYSEHLLKNPVVSRGMQPDLVLQLGAPLISSEITQIIKSNPTVKHVLVQKLYLHERSDPDHTVTHRISSDVGLFLNGIIGHLNRREPAGAKIHGSELSPLLYLGRELQKEMQHIIQQNGEMDDGVTLTEPQVMMAISEVLSETPLENSPMSLFLSNSMPVRDGEFFLYPAHYLNKSTFPLSVSVNRGASGIDGIISTATGCGDNSKPTTLICGDVSTLHDLNALYGLTQDGNNDSQSASAFNQIRLSTVIVNNGGGAIFSFLPISKHGQDVGFEEYWGTPTRNFSFQQGASAFGLSYTSASSFKEFKDAYRASIQSGGASVIEAKVVGRATNVEVHQQITREAKNVVDGVLGMPPPQNRILPIKWYNRSRAKETKTLLLLHGWMGDNSEWDLVGDILSRDLSEEWNIVSIDLPGHGNSSIMYSSDQQMAHFSLGLDALQTLGQPQNSHYSLDVMARTVCNSLILDHGIMQLDAIAGYSLGGRIALAMKKLFSKSLIVKDNDLEDVPASMLVTDQTRMILLGSNPGKLPNTFHSNIDDFQRLSLDHSLAESLFSLAFRSFLVTDSEDKLGLTQFVTKWYSSKSLWGGLKERHPTRYQLMVEKRVKSLFRRRRDIASVLYGCSPPNTSQDDWKAAVPSNTIFVAGALDKKYSKVGRAWENMSGIAQYIELDNAGHALLVEVPEKISSTIAGFITDISMSTEKLEYAMESWQAGVSTTDSLEAMPPLEDEDITVPAMLHQVGVLEYEAFSINIGSSDGSKAGVRGIGWGESAQLGNELTRREGFIISIASRDGMAVGVGEVSPLKGLHSETLQQAETQVKMIKEVLSSGTMDWPEFDAARVLSLDGSLTDCVHRIFDLVGINATSAAASVRSGLEMALLSMSSQLHGSLLPQALSINQWRTPKLTAQSFSQLPINGLITKGELRPVDQQRGVVVTFQSLKVKVGHGDSSKDALHLIRLKESSLNSNNLRLRADANRAWNIPTAAKFAEELRNAARSGDFDLRAFEFIEEPVNVQTVDGIWNFRAQVDALETFADVGGLRYALDESLADLVALHGRNFESIAQDLRNAFGGGQTNCAAFVLKPALLGLELSAQLARLAQDEFKLCPVFSSSFDSGIGLAFTAILAAVSDSSPFATSLERYAHGLGTYEMLGGDTLSPPFESYVNKNGMLNVPSLSRALYGLSLDEMSDRLPSYETTTRTEKSVEPAVSSSKSESYLATTSSISGRDITVSVSLPLPFSDGIASSRFTDLPQMSRWSPWLNSVTYLDESPGLTEWNLSIRGVRFSWRAKSEVLTNPKGIRWESTSGLKNRGVVEFEPTSDVSCIMKLKMSIIMPYILVSLFQGMPSVVQKFLENKLLKWSLEMFRDVVKADLALERGDQELGDALFGAVEGRANALEEALK